MKYVVRLVLCVPFLGLAIGCGSGSNESQADIQGTAPLEGAAPVDSTPAGRAKMSEQNKPNLEAQGYPGA